MTSVLYGFGVFVQILWFALTFACGVAVGIAIMLGWNFKTHYPKNDGWDHRGEENLPKDR